MTSQIIDVKKKIDFPDGTYNGTWSGYKVAISRPVTKDDISGGIVGKHKIEISVPLEVGIRGMMDVKVCINSKRAYVIWS